MIDKPSQKEKAMNNSIIVLDKIALENLKSTLKEQKNSKQVTMPKVRQYFDLKQVVNLQIQNKKLNNKSMVSTKAETNTVFTVMDNQFETKPVKKV